MRELFGYFVPEIGLRADGQDRAADRVGVMRAVLFGVGLARALRAQSRIVLGRAMRAMCLARIFGIPGGLGNPLGTDGGGVRGCEHVHPAPVDVEDRAVDEGGLV